MTTAVRRRPAPLAGHVDRVERVTPHLVRVTVGGPELAAFPWPGPAGHLKLILPTADGSLALPEPDADSTVAFAPEVRGRMRTYTARGFADGLLTLELVLHGDGLASRWAETVAPGDPVAVSRPRRAGFVEDPGADWLVVAGDSSALPAIASIAEALTRETWVVVELADPADRTDLAVPVQWLEATEVPGAAVEAALAAFDRPGSGQVWVAGEAASIRRVRRDVQGRLATTSLTTRGYWRLGETNHPDHDHGEDDA